MQKRPIIGIVGRSRMSDTGFCLMATPESERMAIIAAGGNPILILPPQIVEYEKCMDNHPTPSELARLTDEELNMIYQQISLCDGVVLPGGSMMFEYDRKIAEYCHQHQIPLLGICMGMQVMCTYDQEVNLQKIETNINHKDLEHAYVHKVKLDPNSKLYGIIKKHEFEVNSRHAFQILSAGKLKVSGYSEDGIIESVEDPSHNFFIGVQWHPELNFKTDEISKRIWESFINHCQ